MLTHESIRAMVCVGLAGFVPGSLSDEPLRTSAGFVTPISAEEYKREMRKLGTWGGRPEVSAAAASYDVTIIVFSPILEEPELYNYRESGKVVAVHLQDMHYTPCRAEQVTLRALADALYAARD